MKRFLHIIYVVEWILVIAALLSLTINSFPAGILLIIYQLAVSFILMLLLYTHLERTLQLRFNYYWAAVLLYILAFGAIGGLFLLTVLPIAIALFHLYLSYRLTKIDQP